MLGNTLDALEAAASSFKAAAGLTEPVEGEGDLRVYNRELFGDHD